MSDIEIGSTSIRIFNVKKFRFRRNYDLQNSKKEVVATVNITLNIKNTEKTRRGVRGEQGSKIEILSENSQSVSLENEEEEYEDDGEGEGDYEVYDEQQILQQQLHNVNQIDHNMNQIDSNRRYVHGYNQQPEPDQYPVSGEGDYESDEDPIPDDEENDDEKEYQIMHQNKHKVMPSHKKSPNFYNKKKVRSTSHTKQIKSKIGRPKGTFNYRKASNRPYLKETLTPHNIQDSYQMSRNHPTNLSHAQTHYSPKGFKNLGVFEGEYDDEVESYHTNFSRNLNLNKVLNRHPGSRARTRNPTFKSNYSLRAIPGTPLNHVYYGGMTPQQMHFQTYDQVDMYGEDEDLKGYDYEMIKAEIMELKKERYLHQEFSIKLQQ